MDAQTPIDGPSRAPEPVTADQAHGEAAQELIAYLEPDQLVAETFRPVTQATLTSNAAAGLWALRVFVVLVSLMVLYTFIARLH